MTTIRVFVLFIAAALPALVAAGVAHAEHPPLTLLDQDGRNVLESGMPVSTMRSCDRCHDTQYIATHSSHVRLNMLEQFQPDSTSAVGNALRGVPGNGVAASMSIHGTPRRAFSTGDRPLSPGSAEMDCFLCHTPNPDNVARVEALRSGRARWANTATLASTGLVHPTQDGWSYQREAFLPDGRLDPHRLGLREPTSENCGLCHGLAERGRQPIRLDLSSRRWSAAVTGQVFSPQRVCDSAVNLKDKERLTHAWDVHAERLLECTSCHWSINNPAFYEPAPGSRPKHLTFEPRRLTVGQYLERPNHQIAGGSGGPMRSCEDCHNAADTHDWLPYQTAHFSRLSCEACHITKVDAPAIRQVDWTLLTPKGEPQIHWRGIEGEPGNPAAQVTGFLPVLLPKEDRDGRVRLAPHNLVTTSYWIEGGPKPRPVSIAELKSALLEDGKYRPDVARALGDGQAVLDTPEKVDAVRRRLQAVGVVEPRIEAEIQPYGLHHGVGPAKEATRNCEACHTGDSRLAEPFVLASCVPAGVVPRPAQNSRAELNGRLNTDARGQLTFEPSTRQASLYVLGHNRWVWVNALGGLWLLAVVLGVTIHAGLRVRVGRRKRAPSASVKE